VYVFAMSAPFPKLLSPSITFMDVNLNTPYGCVKQFVDHFFICNHILANLLYGMPKS
jgi:hypothetical protein